MKNFLASLFVCGYVMVCMSGAGAQDTKERKQSDQTGKSGPADTRKSTTESASTDSPAAQDPAGEQPERIVRSEKEWRKLLTREEYRVLRGKGTEKPFRNKYDKHFEPGTYACAACGQELFAADAKFNSGCGWPAFYASMAGERVVLSPDHSLGMVRIEVTCARCDSHLGHIFNDAPQTPTGQRYCINSVSLKFIPAESRDQDKKVEQSPAERKSEPPAAQDQQKSAK